MQGRLNIFQRTMLEWNDLHPYSAVHVVGVPAPFDRGRLSSVIETLFEASGLTGLVVDRNRGRYHYRGGACHYDVREVPCGAEPGDVLEREIETELNMPFPASDPLVPIRFFAAVGSGRFHLGLVYNHFVAGADSIVHLLKALTEAYMRGDVTAPAQQLNCYPGTYCAYMNARLHTVWDCLVTLPSFVRTLKQSYRPIYRDFTDQRNGLCLFTLSQPAAVKLHGAARALAVTVNDVLLAALLKAVSPLASGRFDARRKSISVAAIANIRKDFAITPEETFGLFLGFMRVTHAVPTGAGMETIALDVNRQTAEIKRKRLYLRAPLELAFGRFIMKRFTPERQRRFHAKFHPLWGGLTNVNLDTLWDGFQCEMPIGYIRAVSTGPVCPAVFSVTTVGSAMNGSVSYRKSAFSERDVRGMIARFSEAIAELGVCE